MKKKLLRNLITIAAGFFLFAMVTSCSSSGNGNSGAKVSLPPGTALVDCEIVSTEETDSFFSAVINIKEVKRYGASSPLISSGENLNVRINKSLLDNSFGESSIRAGEEYELLIKNNTAAGNINYWETLEIKK